MSKKKFDKMLFVTLIGFLVLLLIEVFQASIFGDGLIGGFLYSITTRYLGSILCILIIYKYSAKRILYNLPKADSLLLFGVCMVIAVNNFPFLAYIRGDAYISEGILEIILFAVMCLGVGLFEELAFRGCVFTLILRNKRSSRADVFWSIVLSSAVFGVIHLTNLFAGASFGSVFLQIGYSFLIGAMCSVVLIKTGNVFCCAIIHAVYNFAGTVIPTLGGGDMLNVPTVIITAIIALAVATYIVIELVRFDVRSLDLIFEEEQE